MAVVGGKEQKDRERALNDLRDGYTKIICATAPRFALETHFACIGITRHQNL